MDADFMGNWDQTEWHDPNTAQSRHGYVSMYAGALL